MLKVFRRFLLHGFYVLIALLMGTGMAAAQTPVPLPTPPAVPIPGYIYTAAGEGTGSTLVSNDLPATSFLLYGPVALATDATGNLYFVNSNGANTSLVNIVYNGGAVPGLLSAVTSDIHPGYSYVVAGLQQDSGLGSKLCADGEFPCGDGGQATQAMLSNSFGLFVDSKGNLYIANSLINVIRKVDTTGTINTVAGYMTATGGYDGDGVDATTTRLYTPRGVYVDSDGNIFIADQTNGLIRVVYEGGNIPALLQAALGPGVQPQKGFIYTVMGSSTATTQCTNNSTATNCILKFPQSVWLDAQGNAYVASATSYVIYKVDATTANVSIYAGTLGTKCASPATVCGDGGLATQATLARPGYAKLAPDGKTLFFEDNASSVRMVDANGIITTVAGTTNSTGTPSSDGGPAISATFKSVRDLALDAQGNLYIADFGNNAPPAGQAVHEVYRETAGLLTFTADSQTITYGSPINLTYTTTGLFPEDSITTPPTVTTTATQGSQPDTYPITFTGQASVAVTTPSGAPNPPYIDQFVDGTLTITGGGMQTIPALNLASSYTYGQAAIPLPATASSGLPITYKITTQNGPASIGGTAASPTLLITGASTNPVTLTASQAGNNDYAAAQTLTASFTVAQAPLIVKANNVSLAYGIYNPSTVVNQLTYTMSGFVENPGTGVYDTQLTATTGAATVSTTAQSSSLAGTTWPITISQGNLGAANYYFQGFNGATLTITGTPDYAVMADPTSLTMLNGQLRAVNVIVAPRGGYKGTITLSCGNLPANVGCIWSQQTVSIDGTGVVDGYSVNGQQVSVTIYSGTAPVVSSSKSDHGNGQSLPGWPLASFGMAAVVLGAGGKRFRSKVKLIQLAVIVMVVLAVGSAVSCGGSSSSKNSSGAQTGTSTIQIVATDANGKTNKLPITVTIQ